MIRFTLSVSVWVPLVAVTTTVDCCDTGAGVGVGATVWVPPPPPHELMAKANTITRAAWRACLRLLLSEIAKAKTPAKTTGNPRNGNFGRRDALALVVMPMVNGTT